MNSRITLNSDSNLDEESVIAIKTQISRDLRGIFHGKPKDFCIEAYTHIGYSPQFLIFIPQHYGNKKLFRKLRDYVRELPFETMVRYI